MSQRKIEIVHEKRVYNGYTKVDDAIIKDALEDGTESTYMRQKVVKFNAAAGLIYNVESENVILVKQYRYPTHIGKRNGLIYEAVAGKIDDGEEPKDAFIREALEEVGYKLKEKNVEYCFRCFMTPGYSTEQIFFFIATATNKDKIKNAGGGLKGENENIEICEFHHLQFESMINDLDDAKTKLLAYEALHRKLFDRTI